MARGLRGGRSGAAPARPQWQAAGWGSETVERGREMRRLARELRWGAHHCAKARPCEGALSLS